MTDKINQLKAQAYDIVLQLERLGARSQSYREQLTTVNKDIVAEQQKDKTEGVQNPKDKEEKDDNNTKS